MMISAGTLRPRGIRSSPSRERIRSVLTNRNRTERVGEVTSVEQLVQMSEPIDHRLVGRSDRSRRAWTLRTRCGVLRDREPHEATARSRALGARGAARNEAHNRAKHVIGRRGITRVQSEPAPGAPADHDRAIARQRHRGAGRKPKAEEAIGERKIQLEHELRNVIRQCPATPPRVAGGRPRPGPAGTAGPQHPRYSASR